MKAIYFERTAPAFNRLVTMYARGIYIVDEKKALIREDLGIFRDKDYRLLDRESTAKLWDDLQRYPVNEGVTYDNIREIDIPEHDMRTILVQSRDVDNIQNSLNRCLEKILKV